MAVQGQTTVEQHGNEIILSRIYDAPRALVFSMFNDPERIAKWWGPTTWPVRVSRMDFRPGGTWLYCMEGPEGQQAWGKAVYEAIDEPNRIVFTDYFSDAEGNKAEGFPQADVIISFEEAGGKTLLRSKTVYPTANDLQQVLDMGMEEGVKDTWDQLDRLLQKETSQRQA